MKGSGVMHPLSSDVVKACLPSGQIKVRGEQGRVLCLSRVGTDAHVLAHGYMC
jgi:hypothetical protein